MKVSTPILSIITITKDDQEGISATINSTNLLRKSNNIEQIVVDSSTEKLGNKIEKLVLHETNLKYNHTSPAGISNAFNNGIKISTGKWLWFLNGGDELINDKNGNLMLNIIEKSTADIIVFKIAYGEKLIEREFPPMWLQWPPISSWLPHPGMIIKKELFEKYGNYKSEYKGVMDFDLWLKITSGDTKIDLVSIPLVKFDINGYSSTQGKLIAKESLRSIRKNSFTIFKTLIKRNWLIFNDLYKTIKTAYF